jgi:hypothetical protein
MQFGKLNSLIVIRYNIRIPVNTQFFIFNQKSLLFKHWFQRTTVLDKSAFLRYNPSKFLPFNFVKDGQNFAGL